MKNFDKSWDLEYSKGNALNEYPFDFIVTLTFKYFGKVKNKGSVKVLDVRCGAGNNSEFFAREGFDVFGIDGSDTAIKYTKERFKNKGLNVFRRYTRHR
jgi:2-polyprenyl-3-methyl-5-hydroxy-6-metoxy-1,4-benzoquinol methylase